MSSKPKPSTISHDPYAFIAKPESSPVQPEVQKPQLELAKKPSVPTPSTEKITTPYPAELIERVRNAAYWERLTLTGIIVQAVAEAIDKMEQGRGEPYPPRAGELKGGRPIGSGNARNT